MDNTVLVKESTGKWMMCVDFRDIDKVCPKDCYPIPLIDQLVDVTSVHELISFMDTYYEYNKIRTTINDASQSAFYADSDIYNYAVMPFWFINAGAT